MSAFGQATAAILRPAFSRSSTKVNSRHNNHRVVVIGKESTGKSQLVASLTGGSSRASGFRGSTVACETYRGAGHTFVDTPGILRKSDALTTRTALGQLEQTNTVLLVVQATHLDDELADLLPLVKDKQGAVAVTFWDKVNATEETMEGLERLSRASGLPFVPVDARRLSGDQRIQLLAGLLSPEPFPQGIQERAGWRIEPKPTLLEHQYLGPVLAVFLLLLPAVAAVWAANTFAGLVDPAVQSLTRPLAERLGQLPSPASEVLAGRYGFLTMGPLLFVWAVPTVVLYSLFLSIYKASGLIDRITTTIHPLVRPLGLSGRDLVRVVMGFGCNVPAVISTRACSSCSRGTCISAIAFGAACSYQLGATLGVFAAAGLPYLILPYLLFLSATTLVYVRLTAPREARSPLNLLLIEGRNFLQWPGPSTIWRETRGTLGQFFLKAIPIFFVVTLIASLLDWLGVIWNLAAALGPLMALFHLPAEAALPVVLASVRKDGILLFAEPDLVEALTPLQVLTGVYLAGVLLPCLVTMLTIAREQSKRFVLKLIGRQALAATIFTVLLAWGGTLLSR